MSIISIHAPSRGRLPGTPGLCEPAPEISIHAPSRGRLPSLSNYIHYIPISIHAPSRGRRNKRAIIRKGNLFQSTPPRGGDFFSIFFPPFFLISIHAPSRGRRCHSRGLTVDSRYFNPRPLAGATSCIILVILLFSNFNPRPLAGATTAFRTRNRHRPYFNPRPLAGATDTEKIDKSDQEISIHAPSRGRRYSRRALWTNGYFNPRPLAGAT